MTKRAPTDAGLAMAMAIFIGVGVGIAWMAQYQLDPTSQLRLVVASAAAGLFALGVLGGWLRAKSVRQGNAGGFWIGIPIIVGGTSLSRIEGWSAVLILVAISAFMGWGAGRFAGELARRARGDVPGE